MRKKNMNDPVEYINKDRLKFIRTNIKDIALDDLIDVCEHDIRKLMIDQNETENLMDVIRAIRERLKK